MIQRVQKHLFHGNFLAVLLEAGIGAAAALFLVFSVIHQIPAINIPATFFFLVQIPVFWAALRLAPAFGVHQSRVRWGTAILRELAFALALRLFVFSAAWYLSAAFQTQKLIQGIDSRPWLNLLIFTACFLPFLGYRLVFYTLYWWVGLTRRSLLWTQVNSHLVVFFSLIALGSLVGRLTAGNTSIVKYEPPGLLARLVLEYVRGIIPWVGVSMLFLVAVGAALLPPAFLASYLSSRRFVRRIQALATSMQRARQGDLSVRVKPSGEDEVAQLQADFNYMVEELQEEREKVNCLLKNQRELAAVVSHELRTPITVIRAYVENNLIEKSALLPAEVSRDLNTIQHEILSLQNLVEDLFTLSRLDTQRLELNCAWVDLSPIVERVQAIYQPLAWKNKRIDLSANLPVELPQIWGDAQRIEQIFGNLAQNAIRHTPDGGVIILSACVIDEFVEISLQDTGEGIVSEDLPHIWERFYRGSQGRGSGRTGIGLSLVKDLVEAMDGSVGIESRVGEGSRFWVRLRSPIMPV